MQIDDNSGYRKLHDQSQTRSMNGPPPKDTSKNEMTVQDAPAHNKIVTPTSPPAPKPVVKKNGK